MSEPDKVSTPEGELKALSHLSKEEYRPTIPQRPQVTMDMDQFLAAKHACEVELPELRAAVRALARELARVQNPNNPNQ